MLLLCIFLLALFFFIRNKRKEDLSLPPGPPKLPVVGNLWQMSALDPMPHEALAKLGRIYGDIMSVKIGSMDAVVLSSHNAIRALLANRALSDRVLDSVIQERNMGQNLGINWSNGPVWVKMRRFMTKSLHSFGYNDPQFMDLLLKTQLATLVNQIEAKARAADGALKLCMDGPLRDLSMKVMWALILGQSSLKYLNPEKFSRFVKLSEEVVNAINLGSTSTIEFPTLRKLFPKWSGRNWVLEASAELNAFVKEMVSIAVAESNNNTNSFAEQFLAKIKLGDDPDFTLDQMTICLLDMLQGGGDTMAAILNFAVYYLATEEKVQAKLQDEISATVGSNGQISLLHKHRMPYTEAVILEIIRHGIVLPIPVPRRATQDFEHSGYKFKKGTAIMANIYAVFRDPDLWEEPKKFNPNRFLDEEGNIRKEVADIVQNAAFGAGIRMCPAMKLANNWLFLYVTTLVQKFEFIPAPEVNYSKLEPVLGLTLGLPRFNVILKQRVLSILSVA